MPRGKKCCCGGADDWTSVFDCNDFAAAVNESCNTFSTSAAYTIGGAGDDPDTTVVFGTLTETACVVTDTPGDGTNDVAVIDASYNQAVDTTIVPSAGTANTPGDWVARPTLPRFSIQIRCDCASFGGCGTDIDQSDALASRVRFTITAPADACGSEVIKSTPGGVTESADPVSNAIRTRFSDSTGADHDLIDLSNLEFSPSRNQMRGYIEQDCDFRVDWSSTWYPECGAAPSSVYTLGTSPPPYGSLEIYTATVRVTFG